MSVIRPVRVADTAEVEHLVVDPGHRALPGPDMTAAQHALGRESGGDVERARRGRPPVHQQSLVIVGVVENADPAYITALTLGQIQPAKAQPVFRRVELGDPPRVHLHETIAL
jgi:hypothetical protein